MYPYFYTPMAHIKLPWYIRLIDFFKVKPREPEAQFDGYHQPYIPAGYKKPQ